MLFTVQGKLMELFQLIKLGSSLNLNLKFNAVALTNIKVTPRNTADDKVFWKLVLCSM